MDNNDLEKLKLLSNNTEDYLKALLIKLRNNAINNNHEMSYFDAEQGYKTSCHYTAYCKKCTFEMYVEYMNLSTGEKIYLDLTKVDKKCNR